MRDRDGMTEGGAEAGLSPGFQAPRWHASCWVREDGEDSIQAANCGDEGPWEPSSQEASLAVELAPSQPFPPAQGRHWSRRPLARSLTWDWTPISSQCTAPLGASRQGLSWLPGIWASELTAFRVVMTRAARPRVGRAAAASVPCA